MKFYQKELSLNPHPRGFHLITHNIEGALPEIRYISIGQ